MEIREIVYKRLKNLGNYENEQVELKAILNQDESVSEGFKELKNQAELALGLFTCDVDEDKDNSDWGGF